MRELKKFFFFNIHRVGCSVELPLKPNEWKAARCGKISKLSAEHRGQYLADRTGVFQALGSHAIPFKL